MWRTKNFKKITKSLTFCLGVMACVHSAFYPLALALGGDDDGQTMSPPLACAAPLPQPPLNDESTAPQTQTATLCLQNRQDLEQFLTEGQAANSLPTAVPLIEVDEEVTRELLASCNHTLLQLFKTAIKNHPKRFRLNFTNPLADELKALQTIDGSLAFLMRNDESLQNLYHIAHLLNLTSLTLDGCSGIYHLDLTPLNGLRSLTVQDCNNFNTMTFDKKSALRHIAIESCHMFESFDARPLSQLRTLWFQNCYSLKTLNLSRTPNLQHLTVEGCTWLEKLCLANAHTLKILKINVCGLREISGLHNLEHLTTIIIQHCTVLERLTISTLPSLQTFILMNCLALEALSTGQLPHLATVQVDECPLVPQAHLDALYALIQAHS